MRSEGSVGGVLGSTGGVVGSVVDSSISSVTDCDGEDADGFSRSPTAGFISSAGLTEADCTLESPDSRLNAKPLPMANRAHHSRCNP